MKMISIILMLGLAGIILSLNVRTALAISGNVSNYPVNISGFDAPVTTGRNPIITEFNLTGTGQLEIYQYKSNLLVFSGYYLNISNNKWYQNDSIINGLPNITNDPIEIIYAGNFTGNNSREIAIASPIDKSINFLFWNGTGWQNITGSNLTNGLIVSLDSVVNLIPNFPVNGRGVLYNLNGTGQCAAWQYLGLSTSWSQNNSLCNGLNDLTMVSSPTRIFGGFDFVYNMTKNATFQMLEITRNPSIAFKEWNGTGWGNLTNNLTFPVQASVEPHIIKNGFYPIGLSVLGIDGNTVYNFTNLTLSSYNHPPIPNNVSITELPLSSGSNAKGHCNYTDQDGDVAGGNQTYWYVNKSIINEANNSFQLLSGNVTLNSNITFSCRYNDTFIWSNWVNSSTVNVGDTTAPVISNQTINGNSFTINDIINITIITTDNSGIINYVRVQINSSNNGTNFTMNLLDNNKYSYSGSFGIGFFNVSDFWVSDNSNNIGRDRSNFTFSVTSPTSASASGGGGGGGLNTVFITIVNQTNVTSNCNFNQVCEGNNGEDPISCPTDCKLNLNYLTCDDPGQKCITDFFGGKDLIARVSFVLLIGSVIVVLSDNNLRKKFRVK